MKLTGIMLLILVMQFSGKVIAKDVVILQKAPAEQNVGKKISGTVSDDKGQPIPGATVSIEGTTKGVISDMDGNYTINAESQNTLVFSFIGYATQKIRVGEKKDHPRCAEHNYGTVRRRNCCGLRQTEKKQCNSLHHYH